MSEILDDMFDEALKLEQESDDNDGCGEIVIQASKFCALNNRIKELEEQIEKMKCCDFADDCGCKQCPSNFCGG